MFEVAERWYQHFIPQAREIVHKADLAGKKTEAAAVAKIIEDIMARPEHRWNQGSAGTVEGTRVPMPVTYLMGVPDNSSSLVTFKRRFRHENGGPRELEP